MPEDKRQPLSHEAEATFSAAVKEGVKKGKQASQEEQQEAMRQVEEQAPAKKRSSLMSKIAAKIKMPELRKMTGKRKVPKMPKMPKMPELRNVLKRIKGSIPKIRSKKRSSIVVPSAQGAAPELLQGGQDRSQ